MDNHKTPWQCECGFIFCDNFLTYGVCTNCDPSHALMHDYYIQTNGPVNYTSNVSKFSRIHRCPSCEEPVNRTGHKCKAESKSKDWLDVMKDLK